MHRYVRATRGATRRAVRVARRGVGTWWVAPVLVAAVAVDDAVLVPRAPGYAVLGVLDEPAHLATSVIVLSAAGAVARLRGRALPASTVLAGLVAGNLIDADHLPMVLGSDVLTAGTPRPYSHSLLTLSLFALVALVAAVVRRRPGPGRRRAAAARTAARLAAGAALGVGGHLLRDLATAPVALFWPLTTAGITIPYGVYLALLGAAALVAAASAVRPARSGPARSGPARSGPARSGPARSGPAGATRGGAAGEGAAAGR